MLALPSQVFVAHHYSVLLTSLFLSLFTYMHIVFCKSIYVHTYFSKCHTSSETDTIGITAAAKQHRSGDSPSQKHNQSIV